MKKVLAVVAAAGILAVASLASAATIVNSAHNLSSTGTGVTKGTAAGNTSQICVYCHAPHQTAAANLLWNRNNPTASTFTLYSGVGMASRQFASGFTTDSTSLFCMSCHDGSTTMSNVHNAGANIRNASGSPAARSLFTGTIIAGSQAILGTDMRGTHPVNFPVATVDPTLHVGSGSKMGSSSQYSLFATNAAGAKNPNADRTTNRSLECGSCHAVHDSQYSPFLRDTMHQSQLCLGCHQK